MNVGEKIKATRKARKITQSQLAGDFMTRNMVSCIENGSANPSLETLSYIAERLSVPTSYLLSDDGDLFFYEKREKLPQIYDAYSHGEYFYCIKKITNCAGGSKSFSFAQSRRSGLPPSDEGACVCFHLVSH